MYPDRVRRCIEEDGEEFGTVCRDARDCLDGDLSWCDVTGCLDGTGGPWPDGCEAASMEADCEDGSWCEFATDTASGLTGVVVGEAASSAETLAGEPAGACGSALVYPTQCLQGSDAGLHCRTYRDCVNGASSSPCAAANECVAGLTGAGTSGPCAAAARTVNDCAEGTPAVPCDPRPEFDYELTGCVAECEIREYGVGLAPGPEIPQVYLITCLVELPDPINGGSIGVPVPTLSPTDGCPLGLEQLGDAQGLLPREYIPLPGIVNLVDIETGVCEVTATASAYGSPPVGLNRFGVPCASVV